MYDHCLSSDLFPFITSIDVGRRRKLLESPYSVCFIIRSLLRSWVLTKFTYSLRHVLLFMGPVLFPPLPTSFRLPTTPTSLHPLNEDRLYEHPPEDLLHRKPGRSLPTSPEIADTIPLVGRPFTHTLSYSCVWVRESSGARVAESTS